MQDALPLKTRKLRIRRRFIPIALAAIAVAGGLATGLYLWLSDGGETSTRVVTGVQFPYPDGWSEQALTDADRQAGLILKLDHDEPDASFLARTVVAALPQDFDVNALAADTEEALAADIEGFELIRRDVSRVGSYDAVEIDYLQQAEDEFGEHRILMVIAPTPNQTFYLTIRAERADFPAVEHEGRETISTFMTYVEAAGQ